MPGKPLPQSPNAANAVPETQISNNPTVPPSSGGPPELLLQPGARPLPDFELVRRLGKGGFGEVWHARGLGGLDFALKFIELEARGSALEVRTLEVVKTIRHPNLVGLSGVWRQDKWLILAMELCDRSLQDRLHEVLAQQQPGIPMKELLGYMRDAAAGLDALREHDVQHRDVKPLNLLLMHKGVKVADFGLAKVLEQTAASHTGAMTPAYAAPECFNGQVTHHSDQYSLAVTYFHLRTGRLLFEGNQFQMMHGHISQPPDLSALPEAERTALARALAKAPAERWPSCEAFVNALMKAYNRDRQGEKNKKKADEPSPMVRTKSATPQQEKQKTDKTERPLPPVPWKKQRTIALLAACLLMTGLPLLLSLAYFYGSQIIRIATNQGQIVVEVDDPKMEVLVKDNGVTIHDGIGRREITVAAGAHELDVTIKDAAGETRLPTQKLTLSRGGKEVLNIRQELALAKKPDETVKPPVPETKKLDDEKPDPVPEPKKPIPPQPAVLPPTVTVELGNGVTMEFVLIDPKTKPDKGVFRMGAGTDDKDANADEKPQHEVTLTKAFYLAKYPLTQEQYVAITGKKNPSYFSKEGIGAYKVNGLDNKRFPVENVSWNDAKSCCGEMTKKDNRGRTFRLPTEAEWEYACRAGIQTAYCFGDDPRDLGEYAWFEENSGSRPHEVGTRKPNPWGLYDMHGNVWQWCEDYYGPYEGEPQREPLRLLKHSEERRVLRGGSWDSSVPVCRAASRNGIAPVSRGNNWGFRVAFRLD